MSRKKVNTSIIVHISGLVFLILVITISWIMTAFGTVHGGVFPKRYWLSLSTWKNIANFSHKGLDICAMQPEYPENQESYSLETALGETIDVSQLDVGVWQVSWANSVEQVPFVPDASWLMYSAEPVQSIFVIPSCEQSKCSIEIFSLEGSSKNIIPAYAGDPGSGTDYINRVIFDEARQLIMYETRSEGLSSMIVLNFAGKLIQSIDTTPGIERTLDFLGYDQNTGVLLFQDTKVNLRLGYVANDIHLVTASCQ